MSIEIPRRVRAIVRARESSLILLAVIVGAMGVVVVVTMATEALILTGYRKAGTGMCG
jgi:hypothetical protein